MTNTTTTAGALLKQIYSSPLKMDPFFKLNPFYMKLKKVSVGGASYEVPVAISPGGGRGASASNSFGVKSIASYTQFARFSVTKAKNFNQAVVDGQAVVDSETNKDAYMKILQSSMDYVMEDMTNDIAMSLFRDGSGVRGRISSTQNVTGATTITLQTLDDVNNFHVGQYIVASTASDGSGIKQTSSSDNVAIITAVDGSAGTLTFDVAVDSFGSNDWAASDYLYVQGDPTAKIRGLDAWIPTVLTATSFYGVNRTTDREKLAGLVFSSSGLSIRDTILTMATRAARKGAAVDTCYLSHENFSTLAKELGSQIIQSNMKVGTIGFETIKLLTSAGPVSIFADNGCPDNVLYLLRLDTWELIHSDKNVIVLDDKPSIIDRLEGSDSHVVRIKSYAQLVCKDPSRNAKVLLT